MQSLPDAFYRKTRSVIAIDYPRDHRVVGAYEWIEGWIAINDKHNISARISEIPIQLVEVPRPDMPGAPVFGFRAYFTLVDVLRKHESKLAFELFKDGRAVGNAELLVPESAWENAIAEAAGRAKKLEWIMRNSQCPNCRSKPLEWSAVNKATCPSSTCRRCSARFTRTANRALNFLRRDAGLNAVLEDKVDPVSDHFYDGRAQNLLRETADNGGMIVDLGAGYRRYPYPNVVALEIYDYPSTDIIATVDAVPLTDGSVDAAYCAAVLEHVSNPFKCASEILRILKPGGLLISGIPFLQPQHGYPHHYFNCTRSGHLELYKDAIDVVDFLVDESSQPWYVLMWFLNLYREGLPGEARAELESM